MLPNCRNGLVTKRGGSKFVTNNILVIPIFRIATICKDRIHSEIQGTKQSVNE